MQVIASHRVIAPSRAALASKPVRSLRRASGSVARRSADRVILSTRAMAEEGAADDDFESRLGPLRGKRSKRSAEDVAAKTAVKDAEPVKKATPSGQRRKGVADFTTVGSVEEPAGANWGSETVVYEGPPARGEIIANVAMSWTVVCFP